MKTKSLQLKNTVAYFYSEHYGGYFGVSSFELNPDGTFSCGIATGIYDKKLMDQAGIPFRGVKPENKNILYL